jgi:GNAT superfamily N-acetyltransferase
MIQVEMIVRSEDVQEVRTLFEEYQESIGLDLEFQDFSSELASLPGAYVPPRGRLLLARSGGAAAGCVALRPLSADTCEMKRLYVRPAFRKAGAGRLLAERLIAEARSIGYARMCLDTLPSMVRAQQLYESLGFRDIDAYRYNPLAGTRYMALDL